MIISQHFSVVVLGFWKWSKKNKKEKKSRKIFKTYKMCWTSLLYCDCIVYLHVLHVCTRCACHSGSPISWRFIFIYENVRKKEEIISLICILLLMGALSSLNFSQQSFHVRYADLVLDGAGVNFPSKRDAVHRVAC